MWCTQCTQSRVIAGQTVPRPALRKTPRSHLGYALKGLRAGGSVGVSFVREVTGLRTMCAPGATGQRGREVGVMEGGWRLHCMESTEGVNAVVEV